MRVEFDFDPKVVPDKAPSARQAAEEKPVNQKARQLALAYHIEALVASGEMKDIVHVARVAGVSRARVSQVLDMMLLAPWVQEGVLDESCGLGVHALRRLSGILGWEMQCAITKPWPGTYRQTNVPENRPS